MAVWYSLWSFGIFFIFWIKKNLATLPARPFLPKKVVTNFFMNEIFETRQSLNGKKTFRSAGRCSPVCVALPPGLPDIS
jgi:hypothetical protein